MSAPTLTPPAVLWAPEAVDSYVDLIADVAVEVGRPLDPEQRLAVEVMTRCDRRGRFAAFEACVVEPRRNGKTAGIVLPQKLMRALLHPGCRIVWTAHLVETATESFGDLLGLIESSRSISAQVLRVRRGNGQQAIEFRNGSKVRFLARSTGGGRGLDADDVVLDEALILEPTMLAALLPTMATRENPQVTYAASAGLGRSAHLRTLRDRAQRAVTAAAEGRDPGEDALAYIEWRASPGTLAQLPEHCTDGPECTHIAGLAVGCILDEVTQWQGANPAMGRRIPRQFFARARRALPWRQYATEHLGIWDDPVGAGDAPLPLEAWEACAVPDGRIDGAPTIGLAASWDSARASVVVAGTDGPDDDQIQVEVAAQSGGVQWLTSWLAERWARYPYATVAIRSTNPAARLAPELTQAGWTVVLVGVQEYVLACQDLAARARATPARVRHLGCPVLTAAVGTVATKPRGDGGFVWWQSDSGGDVSALEAATLALHGHATAARPSITC